MNLMNWHERCLRSSNLHGRKNEIGFKKGQFFLNGCDKNKIKMKSFSKQMTLQKYRSFAQANFRGGYSIHTNTARKNKNKKD